MAIDGMNAWLKRIDQLKKELPKETGTFLQKKAEEVIRNTKKLTPVDQGTLQSSWMRKNNGPFRQLVYSNTNYANHIEYGHRVMRKGKVVGYARGRHMLKFGIARVRLTFYKDLGKLYKRLIEK